MPDLTSTPGVLTFLSSFWSASFPERGLPALAADYSSMAMAEMWLEVCGMINSASPGTVKPYRERPVIPIVIRESEMGVGPDTAQYGEGGYYGDQPAGSVFAEGDILSYGAAETRGASFYVPLPPGVIDVGATMLNRPVNPSVILSRGSDFDVFGDVLSFRSNPFEDGRIPFRGDAPDREIVLWATSAMHDAGDAWYSFGHLVASREHRAELMLSAAKAAMSLCAGGPTLALLDRLISAASGLPVTMEPEEVVLSVTEDGRGHMVVTDFSAYRIHAPAGVRASVVEGATLRAGSPLSSAVEVHDYSTNPRWWSGRQVTLGPGMRFGPGIAAAPDETVPVQVVGESPGGRKLVKFKMLGDEGPFWARVYASADTWADLAENLWRWAGVTGSDGSPDYSATPHINPAEFFARCLSSSLCVASVDVSAVPDPALLFEVLGAVAPSLPKASMLIVFVDQDVSGEYDLDSISEEAGIHHGIPIVSESFGTERLEESIKIKKEPC